MTDRDIIEMVYDNCSDDKVSGIVDHCCTWSRPAALKKVRYWLSYGIQHGGDYTGVSRLNSRGIYRADVDALKDAIYLLESFVERRKNKLTKF